MGESYVMNEKRRGFASMSPEVQREIASKGGKACHVKKTGHEWTKEEALSRLKLSQIKTSRI